MSKKLALLLFGKSYDEYIHGLTKYKVEVNFDASYKNYKKYIFKYFNDLGYEIDVYFATNNINKEKLSELLLKLNPVEYKVLNCEDNYSNSRNKKLKSVVECCINKGIKYDLVLITRFDLIFKKNFGETNMNLNKFNLVSSLEEKHLICDNFYLFPYILLEKFYNMIKKNLTNNFHLIQSDMKSINGEINYILDEKCHVAELSFYKISRHVKYKD
jgi:hypothetical protein